MIEQLSVRELLDGRAIYRVPMYQRNYAWRESEIEQLIQDVCDSAFPASGRTRPYYIGTLVVDAKPADAQGRTIYEVVDGQQRFTTLFLLASRLKHLAAADMAWFHEPCLEFESRPLAQQAIRAVFEGGDADDGNTLAGEYSAGIAAGYDIISRRLQPILTQLRQTGAARHAGLQAAPPADPLPFEAVLARFAEHLFHHVQIMRVAVPPRTDLNRYFEVMNNRGEQLEKHEVLKARMLSALHAGLPAEEWPAWRHTLHRVWEAVANMERYVQAGFSVEERHVLFGKHDWSQFVPSNETALNLVLNAAEASSQTGPEDTTRLSLSQLIEEAGHASRLEKKSKGGHQEEGAPERFGSVVNFPNFLLQVLRVITGADVPLDDKQLLPAFEAHVLAHPDAARRVQQFLYDLLKCKWLLDHYVIKREHEGGRQPWSLQRLICRQGNMDYVNTFGREDDAAEAALNRRLLMLLSALHVSAPAQAYKHWLNAALRYLHQVKTIRAADYLAHMEGIARCFVYDRYLARSPAEYYDILYGRQGVLQASSWGRHIDKHRLRFHGNIHTLVFNWLDYLLWCEHGDPIRSRPFHFTFRSSVDHYSPQTPREHQPRLSHRLLHCFGNLCLISHHRNSTLSNHSPKYKRDHYLRGEEDSMKQWLMMKEEHWEPRQIRAHHCAMLALLRNDLHTAAAQVQAQRRTGEAMELVSGPSLEA